MKTNSPFAILCLFFFLVSCSKTIDNTGTCSDGIQNQDEQGVDCGGPCGNPCVSCGDGIRNQGETAVDCGGPCDPCYKRLSAVINGVVWNSQSRNAFLSAPGTLRIYGTNTLKNITLIYSGPFAPGLVSTGAQFTGELRDENGTLYTSVQGGAISFSAFDTTTRTFSGTYRFIGSSSSGGASQIVSNGVFNVLEY
jgi:hypothetical protein